MIHVGHNDLPASPYVPCRGRSLRLWPDLTERILFRNVVSQKMTSSSEGEHVQTVKTPKSNRPWPRSSSVSCCYANYRRTLSKRLLVRAFSLGPVAMDRWLREESLAGRSDTIRVVALPWRRHSKEIAVSTGCVSLDRVVQGMTPMWFC